MLYEFQKKESASPSYIAFSEKQKVSANNHVPLQKILHVWQCVSAVGLKIKVYKEITVNKNHLILFAWCTRNV